MPITDRAAGVAGRSIPGRSRHDPAAAKALLGIDSAMLPRMPRVSHGPDQALTITTLPRRVAQIQRRGRRTWMRSACGWTFGDAVPGRDREMQQDSSDYFSRLWRFAVGLSRASPAYSKQPRNQRGIVQSARVRPRRRAISAAGLRPSRSSPRARCPSSRERTCRCCR